MAVYSKLNGDTVKAGTCEKKSYLLGVSRWYGSGIREINGGWDRDDFRLTHYNRPNQCIRDRHDHTQMGAN